MPTDNSTPQPPRRSALDGLKARDLMASALGKGGRDDADVPVLPGYQLRSVLGRGGMGVVYDGWQESLERAVAIKVLPAESSFDGGLFDRLEREARAMAKLVHPNIVQIHDFLRLEDGGAAIVMERIHGGSLRDLMEKHPAGMPLDTVHQIASQLLAALAAAHAAGVVHRDIKPDNVLIVDEGQYAKLTDFGLALELTPQTARLTRDGTTVGTPAYMAPEQLGGSGVDARADLFSLGMVLYEMSTGKRAQGHFAAPKELRPEIPTSFNDVVLQSLKTDPADRFPTAEAMLEALQPSTQPTTSGTSRRNAMILVAAAAITGVAGIALWQQGRNKTGTKPDGPSRDLLNGIDLSSAIKRGEWRTSGGLIESVTADGPAILAAPVESLGDAYELRWRFERLSGTKAATLFFRTAQGMVTFELDSWEQPGLAGVQMIGGTDLRSGGSFGFAFQNGVIHDFTLTITRDTIDIRNGGKLLQRYEITGKRLEIASPWRWTDEWTAVPIAIGSWSSPTRFHELSLRRL